MTGPQNLKPRAFRALAMATLWGVCVGASRKWRHWFTRGWPSTKAQSQAEKSSPLSRISSQRRAPLMAASILAPERMMRGSASRRARSASP
ncbi:hypothetical protein D3C80_1181710 [compost metagenome]